MEDIRRLQESDGIAFDDHGQLDGIITSLRRLYGVAPADELASQIAWLVRRRDMIREQCMERHRLAFRFVPLLSALVCSGYLKSAGDLSGMLEHAVRVLTSDPALQQHLLHQLEHRVVGRSALYRHRLTVHIAFCRAQAARVASMVADGGVVRYGTVDTSPQAGWDWVMHGARTISNHTLRQLFRDSCRLCGDLLDDQAAELIKSMRSNLMLVQGVPTAVGSGKSSLARKVHAVVHSTRITSSSWRETVHIMNSTFSWTGDLGVESGFWLFRRHLSHLFGQWPIDEDASQHRPPEPEAMQFDIQDEPEFVGGFDISSGEHVDEMNDDERDPFGDDDDGEDVDPQPLVIDDGDVDPYMID